MPWRLLGRHEPDWPFFRFRRRHQSTNGAENLSDSLVVVGQPGANTAFQFRELAGQFAVAGESLAQLHEGANDIDAHFHGLR